MCTNESHKPNPNELICVNPNNILYRPDPDMRNMLELSSKKSKIKGGDWDIKVRNNPNHSPRFKKMRLSFEEHFIEGVPWKQTELCQWAMNKNDIHELYQSDKIDERLKKVDQLYRSMKSKGYKKQEELSNNTDSPLYSRIPESSHRSHEIGIAISRDGELIWIYSTGAHRLLIAKLLNINKIPVRVELRHDLWQQIRRDISISNKNSHTCEHAKKYANHSDLKKFDLTGDKKC